MNAGKTCRLFFYKKKKSFKFFCLCLCEFLSIPIPKGGLYNTILKSHMRSHEYAFFIDVRRVFAVC